MLGRGKDVILPTIAEAEKHKEGDQVFVSVNDDGAWIEQDLYLSKGDFLGALDESLKVASGKAAANGYKGPLLFLKGDRETDYGNMRIVMEWITSSDSMITDVALVVDLEAGE
jgi:biopolymer transport protein TolR